MVGCCPPLQAIYLADMVVVMDNGHVKWVGSPSDSSAASYITFLSPNEFDTFSEVQRKGKMSNLNSETVKRDELDSIGTLNEAEDIIEAEARKEGRVESAVYK